MSLTLKKYHVSSKNRYKRTDRNAGCEAGRSLLNYVKKLYLIEYGSKIQADETNRQTIYASDKTEVITDAKVVGITGEQSVSGLTYKDLKTLTY